jgi:hypothetical protein
VNRLILPKVAVVLLNVTAQFWFPFRWDPFQDCSVSNCRLTYNSCELNMADAVLFHLHRTPSRKFLPDPETPRPAHQRWVFLTDENPFHTFTLGSDSTKMKDYNGIFNWSMTYRLVRLQNLSLVQICLLFISNNTANSICLFSIVVAYFQSQCYLKAYRLFVRPTVAVFLLPCTMCVLSESDIVIPCWCMTACYTCRLTYKYTLILKYEDATYKVVADV